MAYPYPAYAGTPAYYDYSTSASNSPAPDEAAYVYAVPQYQTPSGKRHVRTTSYQSPRGYASPAHFPSPGYYAANYDYASPPVARYDYVSTNKTSTRKSRPSVNEAYERFKASTRSLPKQPVYVDAVDNASDCDDDDGPVYQYIKPKSGAGPPRLVRTTTTFHKKRPGVSADKIYVQTYDDHVDAPVRSRARRSSAAAHSTPKKTTSGKEAPPKPVQTEATAADAQKYKIPAGYSLKNWDPSEEPILLLGSAFDANSLGKWIYDWTVYHHKAGAPITEVAGEMWLLLIKFSGKMKRAEECMPRIRNPDNREMMSDFLKSGDRIWGKLKYLLDLCEKYMWKGAKKQDGKVSMGEKSGVEFVKTIFGRERELERTEKLMTRIRLWNMRFDVNCEDILRRPSAN